MARRRNVLGKNGHASVCTICNPAAVSKQGAGASNRRKSRHWGCLFRGDPRAISA